MTSLMLFYANYIFFYGFIVPIFMHSFSNTINNFDLFFCKQKRAYEMRISDGSSDVCSSDLGARPGEEALQEGTPADARAVRSEGFEVLRKAARAQSVVADRHRRRSNAAGAREAVGFAVERDIGIDPRHQRREIDREIAREATASRLRIGLRRAGEADKVVIDQAAGRQVGRRRTPDRMPELAGKGLGGKGLAVRITVADRDIAKPRQIGRAHV